MTSAISHRIRGDSCHVTVLHWPSNGGGKRWLAYAAITGISIIAVLAGLLGQHHRNRPNLPGCTARRSRIRMCIAAYF